MVMFILLGVGTNLRGVWKCAMTMYGVQCVMIIGITEMPVLFVGNWDIQV